MCALTLSAGASAQTAEPAASSITPDVAVSLAQAAMRIAIGPDQAFTVATFDDEPRDPASVTTASPILVLVGDSRLAPVPGVYSNCQADPPGRTIRCDLRVLDDIIDNNALLTREYQREAFRERLLRLILAHELGHVVLGQTGAFYHGGSDGFSVVRYLGYKNELQADAFAAGRLDALPHPDLDLEYGLVAQLTYQAMKRSLCPDTFPANCPCPGYKNAALCSAIALGPGLPLVGDERFKVTLTGDHPEFIVRFSRLLYLSKAPNVDWYRREARQVLLRVRVRNERGRTESAARLFR